MFSLQLRCPRAVAEFVCADLWDCQPLAVSENDIDDQVELIAGFEHDTERDLLLRRFEEYSPVWRRDETDWIARTKSQWPPLKIGSRLLVCSPWNADLESTRKKIILNPGMASGTGLHACTQLVLEALESLAIEGKLFADVGAGSAILAIAAAQLGARTALAIEPDQGSIETAVCNISLNQRKPMLVAGFADVVRDGWADITAANISGTVLLSILEELLRITKPKGRMVLSGFETDEAPRFQALFPKANLTCKSGWACLVVHLD